MRLGFGEPVPWFTAKSCTNERYRFSSVGGHYVLLAFFGSLAHPLSAEAHETVRKRRVVFDEQRAVFFGVSIDPQDQSERKVAQSLPGLRYFWDFDKAVSQLFGVAEPAEPGGDVGYRPCWVIIDPQLRVVATGTLQAIDDAISLVERMSAVLDTTQSAPVLVLPRVFEPEFCAELIAHFQNNSATESGFMREVDGKTVYAVDPSFKRRSDVTIEAPEIRSRIQAMIRRRLVPEIAKTFNFTPSRIERYVVSCYDAETGGFFRPHRDNTTPGTAHRRFAVTINLNPGDYDGGDLRFPEFGERTYRAPIGGAVVFSCSLLHEATPVTRGKRYAFLPFLYDDEAAKVREANNANLGDGVPAYVDEPKAT